MDMDNLYSTETSKGVRQFAEDLGEVAGRYGCDQQSERHGNV